ncbi:cytochrome c oxidase subunit 4 [Rudaeicoccus suwonensis]|uniref:Cytochrome c oxidase polypeptide 4 n=1 Tax=Rudaeicoccus suwonensis TaxID=657409 RepID=A0A561EBQ2_9MICO|nr:cytochrome c oxidase subunit 4 [Rudaeicoccus suwonensis]TWE13027.1 cytochrome c oxidase subunit IV [Rudaeicoccus suwonensis]
MKIEYKLFGILFAFSLIMALIYLHFTHGDEPVGVVGLFLTAGLCLMIGSFMWWTGRKIDLRPDDDPDGEISDVEGDYGFFSPHSWWPLFLAGSCAVLFLGLAVGWWLVMLAVPLAALCVVGWVFEYFHGDSSI